MCPNRDIRELWQLAQRWTRQGCVAFERELGARVATNTPFFAVRGLDSEDGTVLANRLKRQIEERPIVCAKRDDFFLTAMGEAAAGPARDIAWLASSKIALVKMLAESHRVGGETCQSQTLSVANNGDN